TGGGFRINDAAGSDRIDHARHADNTELLVDLHFGEDRRMGIARMFGVFGKFNELFTLNAIHAAVPHGVCERYRAPRSFPAGDHAFGKNDIVRFQAGQRRTRHLLRRPRSSPRISSAVAVIACATEAAVHDPPSTCDCGSAESPSFTVTLSIG